MAKSKKTSKKRSTTDASPSPSAAGQSGNDSTATLGFESALWQSADKLRNNLDGPSTSTSSSG